MSIESTLTELSSPFSSKANTLIIILAAGHGKRIKSRTSKMLHRIWGEPTAERVYQAGTNGMANANVVVVVGVKAEEVANAIGKRKHLRYVYQKEQNGTGHAVHIALKSLTKTERDATRYCYVFPGDMGLIYGDEVKRFHKKFTAGQKDMLVMTGIFEGDIKNNYYGRIIRTKERTAGGEKSKYPGMVVEIIEYKDILALDADYKVNYKGETFVYTKGELLETREFNAGVYAFKMDLLTTYIAKLKSNNVQKEIYITDLIGVFNKNLLAVAAASPEDMTVVLGFNNKSVLKYMENIARDRVYEKVKDVITIDDPEDFFLADDVIENILALDAKGKPLDICIGKGVHIGKGAKMNYGLHIHKNAHVYGNVRFGTNVVVYRNVHLSTYAHQHLIIEDDVEILWGNIVKGNISIGTNTRIESSVNITGADDSPTRIGKNVLIKGTSYIFGSTIEDNVLIEHSVIKEKYVRAVKRLDGSVQPVRFVLPQPEGLDSILDGNDVLPTT